MSKKFMTYEQQIGKLKNEKKLVINDEVYAKLILKQTSYYSLIGGYKEMFKNSTTQKYKQKVCFEDIKSLYEFDRELREVFLSYILRVEIQMKSLISYVFCEEYGEQQQEYLKCTNYDYVGRKKRDVSGLVLRLKKANANKEYAYINHARKKHGNIPLWVLMNALTFGSVSAIYKNLTQRLKVKISHEYLHINESQVGKLVRYLVRYRNICAHGERLFSHKSKDSIPDFILHKKMGIKKIDGQYQYGKHDLFAVVIALRYMLSGNDFKVFKKKLVRLLKQYFQKNQGIAKKEMLEYMGFPENWKQITRFRKI